MERENYNDIEIWLDDPGGMFYHIFIGVIGPIREIPLDFFEWRVPDWPEEEWSGGVLTLGEIWEQWKQKAPGKVLYVWEETPFCGTIYQCGNRSDEQGWIKYGTTKGYI